jgi:hypothetical protein
MARVQRHAIKANIGTKTVRLDKPLRGVVAVLAERLESAEPEFVGVAVMWLDDAAFEAERAQGCSRSWCLRIRARSAGVPLVPLRRLAANSHGSTYHPPAGGGGRSTAAPIHHRTLAAPD